MKRRRIVAAILLASALAAAKAQSPDELNLQIHGFATQSFLYSTHNNWNTLDTTDGSAAWTEAVINLTSRPDPRLRIGVQARFFLFGTLSNGITLDWADADYQVNEGFGIRAGKVKTPAGLLNENQDVDPAHLWILLPSSVYSIASRNSVLSHYGAVAYGRFPLGSSFGKLGYDLYGGQRVLGGNDGIFQPLRDKGIALPNGTTGLMYGAVLKWEPPIRGLMLGVAEDSEEPGGAATLAAFTGKLQASHFYQPSFYGQFERRKLMLAGEYTRQALIKTTTFVGGPTIIVPKDQRAFYAMASYKIAPRLTGGIYYSSSFDRRLPVGAPRYQKDWALSARYDCNTWLYLKFEQHIMDGTELGYSSLDNTGGLRPNDRMSLLKLGASF